jgi:hypothetical protein
MYFKANALQLILFLILQGFRLEVYINWSSVLGLNDILGFVLQEF